ncbi:MAG: hypothetical protein ACOC2J_02460 [bacterium]
MAGKKSVVDQERTVNDKELLTFSNLANLEWQFADIFTEQGKEKGLSTNLHDVLSDPSNFVRRNEYGVFEKYIYMPFKKNEDDVSSSDKVIGNRGLRKDAGIAMEYMEKDEGKFLKDWEVIYGADNYKLCKDYVDLMCKFINTRLPDSDHDDIDDISNKACESQGLTEFEIINYEQKEQDEIRQREEEGKPVAYRDQTNTDYMTKWVKLFPSRKEIEDIENKKRRYKIGFFLMETVLTVVLIYSGMGAPIAKKSVYVVEHATRIAIRDTLMSSDILPLQFLGVLLSNMSALSPGFIIGLLKFSCAPVSSYLQNRLNYDLEEVLQKLQDETMSIAEEKQLRNDIKDALELFINSEEFKLDITETMRIDDTGFRVLVLKKGNDIVISYKVGEKNKSYLENKLENEQEYLFSSEYYNIQIVYFILKSKGYIDENTKITFTGFDKGADLSFLNSLVIYKDDFRTSHLFYTKLDKIREYLDFTEKHVNINFKSYLEIAIDKAGDLAFIIGHIMFSGSFASIFKKGATLIMGLFGLKYIYVAIAITFAFRFFVGSINAARAREIYLKLDELNLIRAKTETKQVGSHYIFPNKYVRDQFIREVTDITYSIKGYIKNEFMDQDYIILPTVDGDDVKINKEDALYIIFREPDFELRKKQDMFEVIDNSGIVESLDNSSKFDFKKFGDEWKKIHDVLQLTKNKQGIYEITNIRTATMEQVEYQPSDEKWRRESYEIYRKGKEWQYPPYDEVDWPKTRLKKVYTDTNDKEQIAKEIKAGYRLSYVMNMMGKLQRAYLERMDRIRFNYFDYREILVDYLGNKKEIEKAEHKPGKIHIVDSIFNLKEIEKKVVTYSDGPYIETNEFVFMPFIDTEGNLGNELRVEYIASVFKSFVHCCYESEKQNHNVTDYGYFYNMFKLYKEWSEYTYDIYFRDKILTKSKFRDYVINDSLLRELFAPDYQFKFKNNEGNLAVFNHFGAVQEWLQEDIKKDNLWFYMELGAFDEDSECFYGRQLVLNPEANQKYIMEYKYNPLDCIVGGVLIINALKETNEGRQGFYTPSSNSEIRLVHTNTDNRKFLNEATDNLQKQDDVIEICSNEEDDIKVSDLNDLC